MKRSLDKILEYTTSHGECLVWTRCLNTDGYPRALIDGDANSKVHRVVWEEYNKESAVGKVIRHTCDNPMCINPKHLISGTATENIADRTNRNRHGQSILDPETVKLIRRLYSESNITQKELGSMFKVHVNTVNSLLNRKHWKHVV